MISVTEAKQIITENTIPLEPVSIALSAASGLILAEDIFSKADMPSFNQSAMDGYAFCFADWQQNNSLRLNGQIPAGETSKIITKENEAIRIFTGAAVPDTTDTVVMQEKAFVENGLLHIQDALLKQGSNVRLRGSEIKAGALALTKGTHLIPAAIGFLASIGIEKLCVYPIPKIKILITGNELRQPGEALLYGLVYESNSFVLQAALHQMHIDNVTIAFAKDDPAELTSILSQCINESDLLLITGGVSAGDYDFVTNALKNCGVTELFHKIKQKPGKPLYVGKKMNKLIFGLPGNPSSVLTCFYEYTIPAIEKMMHIEKSSIERKKLKLDNAYSKKSGITHFLKANCSNNSVALLSAQESYRLSSFATANCLVCLEEDGTVFASGDMVEVHLLPF
jgi:molybdopterin molybdotransferase